MNWAGAIRTNREALLTIVTRMFVLAGIRTGRAVAALPRSLRIRILAMLRPAEYAARRLIVMAARGVEVTLRPSGGRGASASNAEDDARRETPRPAVHTAPGAALPDPLPAFALFDPFKRYGHPWLEDGEDGQAGAWHHRDFAPDDPIDATALCRRIRALERALQDLDGQAARLARWRARRSLIRVIFVRPKRLQPLAAGPPARLAQAAENAAGRGLARVPFPRPRRVEHVMRVGASWLFRSAFPGSAETVARASFPPPCGEGLPRLVSISELVAAGWG